MLVQLMQLQKRSFLVCVMLFETPNAHLKELLGRGIHRRAATQMLAHGRACRLHALVEVHLQRGQLVISVVALRRSVELALVAASIVATFGAFLGIATLLCCQQRFQIDLGSC